MREAGSELARKVDAAEQEHARVKQQVQSLREQLRGRSEDPEAFAERVSALEQDVEHHVTEEEGEMFPEVAGAMDERERTRLGERLQARKGELSGSGQARRGRRGERGGAPGRTATGRRQRAKTARARGKAKTRRARTGTRRTGARGAKRATGRSRQRKRARGRRPLAR